MATTIEEFTVSKLLEPKDVKEILEVGINEARAIVNKLSAELVAKKYLVVPHKIPAYYLIERYKLEISDESKKKKVLRVQRRLD